MSDATPPKDISTSDVAQPAIRLLGQYIKDLSFEVPGAPEIFREIGQKTPDIPLSLDTTVRHLEGNAFEVTLSIHADATVGAKKAFILELAYAAIVDINPQVVPEAHIHPILLAEVPRQLFPFVRQIVSETTGNGGFPPMMLEMIDFAALYQRRFGEGTHTVTRNGGGGQPSVH